MIARMDRPALQTPSVSPLVHIKSIESLSDAISLQNQWHIPQESRSRATAMVHDFTKCILAHIKNKPTDALHDIIAPQSVICMVRKYGSSFTKEWTDAERESVTQASDSMLHHCGTTLMSSFPERYKDCSGFVQQLAHRVGGDVGLWFASNTSWHEVKDYIDVIKPDDEYMTRLVATSWAPPYRKIDAATTTRILAPWYKRDPERGQKALSAAANNKQNALGYKEAWLDISKRLANLTRSKDAVGEAACMDLVLPDKITKHDLHALTTACLKNPHVGLSLLERSAYGGIFHNNMETQAVATLRRCMRSVAASDPTTHARVIEAVATHEMIPKHRADIAASLSMICEHPRVDSVLIPKGWATNNGNRRHLFTATQEALQRDAGLIHLLASTPGCAMGSHWSDAQWLWRGTTSSWATSATESDRICLLESAPSEYVKVPSGEDDRFQFIALFGQSEAWQASIFAMASVLRRPDIDPKWATPNLDLPVIDDVLGLRPDARQNEIARMIASNNSYADIVTSRLMRCMSSNPATAAIWLQALAVHRIQ
jgi:hypothetical protein